MYSWGSFYRVSLPVYFMVRPLGYLVVLRVVNNVSTGNIVRTTTGLLTGANKSGVFILCAMVI